MPELRATLATCAVLSVVFAASFSAPSSLNGLVTTLSVVLGSTLATTSCGFAVRQTKTDLNKEDSGLAECVAALPTIFCALLFHSTYDPVLTAVHTSLYGLTVAIGLAAVVFVATWKVSRSRVAGFLVGVAVASGAVAWVVPVPFADTEICVAVIAGAMGLWLALLAILPRVFTLGEALLTAEGLVLLAGLGWFDALPAKDNFSTNTLPAVQALLVGALGCGGIAAAVYSGLSVMLGKQRYRVSQGPVTNESNGNGTSASSASPAAASTTITTTGNDSTPNTPTAVGTPSDSSASEEASWVVAAAVYTSILAFLGGAVTPWLTSRLGGRNPFEWVIVDVVLVWPHYAIILYWVGILCAFLAYARFLLVSAESGDSGDSGGGDSVGGDDGYAHKKDDDLSITHRPSQSNNNRARKRASNNSNSRTRDTPGSLLTENNRFSRDRQTLGREEALNSVRKAFHALGVFMFIPGFCWTPTFMSLAFAVALSGFILVEIVRVLRLPPFGVQINDFMTAFVDERDSGTVLTTHTYLLIGCAAPVWLLSGTAVQPWHALVCSCGVLIVGVGDSAAAVIGSMAGSVRWPGTKKTVEGTVAALVATASATFWLSRLVIGFTASVATWARIVAAIALPCVLEGVTVQIDNIVLPLYMVSSLLVAFAPALGN